MSREFQDWADDFSRTRAGVKFARVVSRNGDGTYVVSNIATGAERIVSAANATEQYAIGSWVIVGSPAASRSVIGAEDMILSRAPRDQRGTSQTTPDHAAHTVPGVAIFGVTPDPIVLVAGGGVEDGTIHGLGLLGGTPTYGDAGITNGSAPTVTPTSISVHIEAAADVTPGDYDLAVSGVTRRRAVRVLAGTPYTPAGSLWTVAYMPGTSGTYDHMSVLRIDLSTMTVFHEAVLPAFYTPHFIGKKSGVIYAHLSHHFAKFDASTGDDLGTVECSDPGGSEATWFDLGTLFAYRYLGGWPTSDGIAIFNSSTDTESVYAVIPSPAFNPDNAPQIQGACWADAGASILLNFNAGLVKWDIATASIVAQTADYLVRNIAADEGAAFVSHGGSISKIDTDTLAITVGPVTIADGGAIGAFHTQMKVIGGYLYATVDGTARFVKYDRDTLAELASVDIGNNVDAFEYADGVFYVIDNDYTSEGAINRIDAATMTLIDRTVIANETYGLQKS